MKTLRLIQKYGKFEAGELVDVADADASELVAQGVAKDYIEVSLKADDKAIDPVIEAAQKAAEILRAEIQRGAANSTSNQTSLAPEFGPFKSGGDFLMEVRKSVKGVSERMGGWISHVKATGMSEAINADGGFLIPQGWSNALLTAMQAESMLLPRTMAVPIASNNVAMPYVNVTTQATSWTGGLTVYKMGEGATKTSSKVAFGRLELKLKKMAVLAYATDELLEDSPMALEALFGRMVATEFALTRDEDIVNGNGANEALGIMSSPCLISVAKETGQAAATIVYENVLKMWKRLWQPGVSKAVWLINRDCLDEVMKMSLTVGTGGSGVIVVNAGATLPQTIFGAPIIWSPHCQTLGTTGDIILADLSQYVTIARAGEGIKTATSIHVKFVEDEVAFRFEIRCDGSPWWSSAVTPKHGANTISPFVALAARA
jgi:HK97 family phage major capsid protein